MILWLDVAEENHAATEDLDTPAVAVAEAAKDEFEFPLPPAVEDEDCHELDVFEIAPTDVFAVEELIVADEPTAGEIAIPLPPPIPAQSLQTQDPELEKFVEADIFEIVMPEQQACDETADASASEAVELEQLSTIERFNLCREIMESAEVESATIATDPFAVDEYAAAAPTIDEVTREAVEMGINSLIRCAEALRQRVADVVVDAVAQAARASAVADGESNDAAEGTSSSDPRDVIYNAREAEVSDPYANDAGTYENGEYDYDYGYEYYSDDYSYEDEYEYEYDEVDDGAGTDVDDAVHADVATDPAVTADDSLQDEDAVQSEDFGCPYADEYESRCPYADEFESGCPYAEDCDEESADVDESKDSADDEDSYDYSYDAGYEFYGDEYDGYPYDDSVDDASVEDATERQEEAGPGAVEVVEVNADVAADESIENDAAAEDDAAFDYESHYDYDYGYDYQFDAEYAD